MSNPLASLNKTKRSPLLLPGVITTPQLDQQQTVPTINDDDHNCKKSQHAATTDNCHARNVQIPPFLNYTLIRNPNRPKKTDMSIMAREDLTTRTISPFNQHIASDDVNAIGLLDDVTTRMAQNNIKKSSILPRISFDFKNKQPTSVGILKAPTDMDLMQLMMTKLQYFETKCAIQEKSIKDKDKKISILEEKLKLYEKANHTSPDETIISLENKNYLLEQRTQQMEKFLEDYGLKWIGTDENADTSANNESITKDERFKCDYDLIAANIKELNLLVDSNEPQIIKHANGATFKTISMDKVRLCLYENGLSLFNGPFRPFDDMKTQRFCIDLMDGYFPSELQDTYPGGVLFDLIDKRDVFYEDKRKKLFEHEGYRLGEREDGYFKKTIETQLNDTQLTVNEFLTKLPTCVVRNGTILNIRDDIADKLQGLKRNENKSESQPIVDHARLTQALDDIEQYDPNVKYARIKVKSEAGEAFIVKIKYTNTIRELKTRIKTIQNSHDIDFDIISTFPHRTFNDEQMTIEQCGLTSNSTVLMTLKK